MLNAAHIRASLVALIVALVLFACAGGPNPEPAARVVATPAESDIRTEEGAEDGAVAAPSSESAVSAEAALLEPESPWELTVRGLELEPGDRFRMALPAGGDPEGLWGTYVYTDDSSIGTAAVHAGVIDFDDGGEVTVEVVEGDPFYIGSNMNGVESDGWTEWPVAFTFLQSGERISSEPYRTITWWTDSADLPEGMDITLTLPPGGTAHSVYGTDVYTTDSSIGTAAVHAGLITFSSGGDVTLRRVDGVDQYKSTARNGVTTESWGAYGSSFVFVE